MIGFVRIGPTGSEGATSMRSSPCSTTGKSPVSNHGSGNAWMPHVDIPSSWASEPISTKILKSLWHKRRVLFFKGVRESVILPIHPFGVPIRKPRKPPFRSRDSSAFFPQEAGNGENSANCGGSAILWNDQPNNPVEMAVNRVLISVAEFFRSLFVSLFAAMAARKGESDEKVSSCSCRRRRTFHCRM